MTRLVRWLPLLAVLLALLGSVGCTARDGGGTRPPQYSAIERPARTIHEETDWYDHIGQVGVVLLVAGVAIAGILVPIFLMK